MTTTEERMKILKMIEMGKISATEGAELLKAVDTNNVPTIQKVSPSESAAPRWLHVRITDTGTGQKKVKINVPLGLVNIGIKMGARFAPDMNDVDSQDFLTSIKQAIKSGERGKIIDVTNEDGEHIEVFVD